jgi:hypothetical protein
MLWVNVNVQEKHVAPNLMAKEGRYVPPKFWRPNISLHGFRNHKSII